MNPLKYITLILFFAINITSQIFSMEPLKKHRLSQSPDFKEIVHKFPLAKKVKEEEFLRLAEEIKKTSNLKSLKIEGWDSYNSRYLGYGWHVVVDAIVSKKSLNKVSFYKTWISDMILDDLFKKLGNNDHIQHLELNGNLINQKASQSLAELLIQNRVLRFLSITHNYIPPDINKKFDQYKLSEEICVALLENTTLTELDFSGNDYLVHQEGQFFVFSELLQRNSHIKKLKLMDYPLMLGGDVKELKKHGNRVKFPFQHA